MLTPGARVGTSGSVSEDIVEEQQGQGHRHPGPGAGGEGRNQGEKDTRRSMKTGSHCVWEGGEGSSCSLQEGRRLPIAPPALAIFVPLSLGTEKYYSLSI